MGNGTGDPARDDQDAQDQIEDLEDLDDIEEPDGLDDQDQDKEGDDAAGDDFDLESFKRDYEGKSPDELIDIIAKQKRDYGKQSTDVGDMRKRLEALEKPADDPEPLDREPGYDFNPPQADPNYGFDPRAMPGPSPAPQPQDDPKKDWDYEKPVDSTRNIVRDELTMFQQASMIRDFNKNKARAKIAFDTGGAVLKKHKNLFGGIEREVKNAVYGYYFPMVMQGAEVDHFMRDEQAWITAAQNIRLRRGEYDRLKVTKTPKPMAHSRTETPGGVRRKGGKRAVSLNYGDDDLRKMMKEYKLTKAEAEDIIRTEQDMIGKGERR